MKNKTDFPQKIDKNLMDSHVIVQTEVEAW